MGLFQELADRKPRRNISYRMQLKVDPCWLSKVSCRSANSFLSMSDGRWSCHMASVSWHSSQNATCIKVLVGPSHVTVPLVPLDTVQFRMLIIIRPTPI